VSAVKESSRAAKLRKGNGGLHRSRPGFRREKAGDSEQDACSTGQTGEPMHEDVLYFWLGGKTQREKQSGYVTCEKQKKQIQHVL